MFFNDGAAVGQLEHRSRISTDLKDFLPGFLIPRKLSDIVDGQHVRRRRPDFFQRFHFGMSRSFTRLSINLLSFFTDDPANPEECGVGMGSSLHYHYRAADFAHTFRHQRLNRSAFFHAPRKMVRVASKTDGALTGHEELG